MEKKTYVKPELEVVEFAVEAGFAESYMFGTGGVSAPDGYFETMNAYGDDSGWK